MLSPADLSAYLDRIGYDGPVEPTRAVLSELHLRHVLAIPFETFDSVTGRTPALDLPSVVGKLVRSRRGGYCYEHNGLFQAVLRAFGFAPVGLLARVLLGQPEDAETIRTHMLLRVPVEGEDLITDVGFGGQVLTGPIRLEAGVVQETPHEPYRLDEAGGTWSLRALVGGEWRLLYRFTLEPALSIDYEVANHYVATHPSSFFATALVAARILPGARLTLLGRRLTEHRIGGQSQSEVVDDDRALRAILAERFGIEVEDRMWQAAIAKVGPPDGAKARPARVRRPMSFGARIAMGGPRPPLPEPGTPEHYARLARITALMTPLGAAGGFALAAVQGAGFRECLIIAAIPTVGCLGAALLIRLRGANARGDAAWIDAILRLLVRR